MREIVTSTPATARPARVAVVQDGARLHYAVPLALHRRGLLERVYCDWYSKPYSASRFIAHMMKRIKPALGQRMLDRYCPGLADARIISNPLLTWRVLQKRGRFKSDLSYFSWESRVKSEWMRRAGFGEAIVLMGFIRSMDPDFCAEAKQRGLRIVGDQMIAPYVVEMREESLQREKFPGWAASPASNEDDAAWIDWEERTWKVLDRITCASEYVREGLIAQGIESQRIIVNPYPVDDAHFPEIDRSSHAEPLTVGFVGSVNLRKGTPYFFQAAAQFDPRKVRFVMVGPLGISQEAADRYRGNVELVGPVPRSQIMDWLGRFDVYYFPTTCEGSAGSVMEAMMTGLPIVTSPNAGAVVRDGTEGRIIRYDDISSAVSAIEAYARDRDARTQAGRAAARRAREFTLEAFGGRLARVMGE